MLTAKQIEALPPKAKSYRVSDSLGLSLRVDPSGAKYWIATVEKLGRRTTVSLGRWPDVSAVEARKRVITKQVSSAGMTFEELATRWHAVKETRLSSSKYSAQIFRRLEVDVYPKIGSLDIAKITRRQLIEVVQDVALRGAVETAHRLAQYIGRILDYAVDCGYLEQHTGSGLGRVLPQKETRHHASLSHHDSGPLFRAIWSYRGDLVVASAVRLLALTCVRSSELAGARWGEIHGDVWVIPAERMKRRIPHVVPLSRQAIDEIERLRGVTHDYIFQSGRGHINNETPRMVLVRLGFAGIQTAHGLRSIFSSSAHESGLWTSEAIERQLAHRETDAVKAAYNRAEHLEERKRLMQWWADFVVRTFE